MAAAKRDSAAFLATVPPDVRFDPQVVQHYKQVQASSSSPQTPISLGVLKASLLAKPAGRDPSEPVSVGVSATNRNIPVACTNRRRGERIYP
eukprot:3619106-Pyramimonas_sp.AAC.1